MDTSSMIAIAVGISTFVGLVGSYYLERAMEFQLSQIRLDISSLNTNMFRLIDKMNDLDTSSSTVTESSDTDTKNTDTKNTKNTDTKDIKDDAFDQITSSLEDVTQNIKNTLLEVNSADPEKQELINGLFNVIKANISKLSSDSPVDSTEYLNDSHISANNIVSDARDLLKSRKNYRVDDDDYNIK